MKPLILLLVSLLDLTAARRYTTSLSCSLDEFNSLYQKVSMEKENLVQLVTTAESKGHSCTYEYITLNVTELFMNFTRYDINNTDALCEAYSMQYGKGGCELGKALPCRELNKTLDILESAVNDLKRLIGNSLLYRRPVPVHDFKSFRQVGGYFYHSSEDYPVFSGGYNHGGYDAYTGFDSESANQLIQLGQGADEIHVNLPVLVPSEGTVNASEINRVVETLDAMYARGFTCGLVLGCYFPAWFIKKYPEIKHYGDSNCKIDTDHPAVLPLWDQALTPLIEKIRSHPALNSYRLGNEVFFRVMYNTTIVSNYTVSKWQQWLMDKYKNITTLNHVWKTGYKNFDQVFFPGKIDPKTHKIEHNDSLIGSVKWYDYCTFNGDRIFKYYSNLIAIIKKTDSSAMTHTKYVNHRLFDDYYCSGIDRIALNNITGWSGCDTRITTAPVSYIDSPFRNAGQYALDWLPTTIAYTWMRTTTPNKPVVDLELHPITTEKFRNGSLPDNHMRAVVWLIHLHGLAFHMTWASPRAFNGSYTFEIVDSYPTLPQAVDGYGKTLSLVNALGPEVLALANAPRPVCMLWSRDSSIQDMYYLYTQVDTFEALSFFGPQPKFIVEPFVEGPNTLVSSNCKVLVVPGQQYVSDVIVDAVRLYVSDFRGNVIFTGNSSVFWYSPIGSKRNSSELEWMKDLPHIPDQDPKMLLRALEPHLAPAMEDRLVKCVDRSTNLTLWGIICRGAEIQNTKSIVVSVVNVLTVPVYVTFIVQDKGRISEATDMYMFDTVDLSSPLRMEPLDTRILQIKLLDN